MCCPRYWPWPVSRTRRWMLKLSTPLAKRTPSPRSFSLFAPGASRTAASSGVSVQCCGAVYVSPRPDAERIQHLAHGSRTTLRLSRAREPVGFRHTRPNNKQQKSPGQRPFAGRLPGLFFCLLCCVQGYYLESSPRGLSALASGCYAYRASGTTGTIFICSSLTLNAVASWVTVKFFAPLKFAPLKLTFKTSQ